MVNGILLLSCQEIIPKSQYILLYIFKTKKCAHPSYSMCYSTCGFSYFYCGFLVFLGSLGLSSHFSLQEFIVENLFWVPFNNHQHYWPTINQISDLLCIETHLVYQSPSKAQELLFQVIICWGYLYWCTFSYSFFEGSKLPHPDSHTPFH